MYHAWAWTTCIEAFVLLVAALAPFTSWRLMAQRRPKVAIVESRICPLQTRSLVDEPAGRLSPDKSPGLLEKGSSRSCASTRFGACVTPPVTRTLGHLAPHPISRGAPPWQASVAVCLGCPWDPVNASWPLRLLIENLTNLGSGPVYYYYIGWRLPAIYL